MIITSSPGLTWPSIARQHNSRQCYSQDCLPTCVQSLISSISDQDLRVGVDGVVGVEQLGVEVGDGLHQARVTLNSAWLIASKALMVFTKPLVY